MFGNLIVIFMPNFIYVFSHTSILLDSGGIFTFSGSVSVKYTLLARCSWLFILSKQMSKSGFSYPDRILVRIRDFQEKSRESQWGWYGWTKNKTKQNKTTNFIENWKITNYITFPPANSLWTNRGGGSWRHITKQDLYIDGLNNSEDTTIQ